MPKVSPCCYVLHWTFEVRALVSLWLLASLLLEVWEISLVNVLDCEPELLCLPILLLCTSVECIGWHASGGWWLLTSMNDVLCWLLVAGVSMGCIIRMDMPVGFISPVDMIIGTGDPFTCAQWSSLVTHFSNHKLSPRVWFGGFDWWIDWITHLVFSPLACLQSLVIPYLGLPMSKKKDLPMRQWFFFFKSHLILSSPPAPPCEQCCEVMVLLPVLWSKL